MLLIFRRCLNKDKDDALRVVSGREFQELIVVGRKYLDKSCVRQEERGFAKIVSDHITNMPGYKTGQITWYKRRIHFIKHFELVFTASLL